MSKLSYITLHYFLTFLGNLEKDFKLCLTKIKTHADRLFPRTRVLQMISLYASLVEIKDIYMDMNATIRDHWSFCKDELEYFHLENITQKTLEIVNYMKVHGPSLELIFLPQHLNIMMDNINAYLPMKMPYLLELNDNIVLVKDEKELMKFKQAYEKMVEIVATFKSNLPSKSNLAERRAILEKRTELCEQATPEQSNQIARRKSTLMSLPPSSSSSTTKDSIYPLLLPNLSTHDLFPELMVRNLDDFISLMLAYEKYLYSLNDLSKSWALTVRRLFEFFEKNSMFSKDLAHFTQVCASLFYLLFFFFHSSSFSKVTGVNPIVFTKDEPKSIGFLRSKSIDLGLFPLRNLYHL